MVDWLYSPDWSEDDITCGRYAGFVYVFFFPDTEEKYIGVKQMYKGIKDAKKIKESSIENGWREYKTSSKRVQDMIDSGMNYTRTILWAFPTMTEANYAEAMLIMIHSLDYNILNMAMMSKCRLPKGEQQRKMRGIIQTIEGWLN